MSFEWKHPNYYKELKKIQESESKKELENNEDKEMSEESQDPQSQDQLLCCYSDCNYYSLASPQDRPRAISTLEGTLRLSTAFSIFSFIVLISFSFPIEKHNSS